MIERFVVTALLTLPCSVAAAAPMQDAVSRPQGSVPQPVIEPHLREDRIGISLFRPEHTDPRELLKYAKELTETRVRYLSLDAVTGGVNSHTRDRFVILRESICVQDDEEGRLAAIEFLSRLDSMVGAQAAGGRSGATRVRPPQVVHVVRLRALSVQSAVQILDSMASNVERQLVPEAGSILLRGTQENIDETVAILDEVDRPAPQMTMHVTLLETAPEGSTTSVGGEVGKAIATLMPGKKYLPVGQFLLRGAAGGNASLALESSFGGDDSEGRRFNFAGRARSWDEQTRTMALTDCEFETSRPPQAETVSVNGEATQSRSGGSIRSGSREKLRTELTLRDGQETVIGSLGGTSTLIVLRMTVD